MLAVGIDPGWSSCGWAITDMSSEKVLGSGSFVPKDQKSILSAIDFLRKALREANQKDEVKSVFIERFVAYRGVQTSSSEEILMFIGALVYFFELNGVTVNLIRAIDWKPKINKWLVKNRGFSNPQEGFNKKFSLLAAKTLSGNVSLNDHEADAVCLSFLYQTEAKK